MSNGVITLKEIANEINVAAKRYKMASFQEIRKKIHEKQRCNNKEIFDENAIKENSWAFHYGGREEIQYNIGFEEIENKKCFRYGLAFSLEPSRFLHKNEVVEAFKSKILRYNEYISLNNDKFSDLNFWYEYNKGQKKILPIGKIEMNLIKPEMFFFIGKYTPIELISYDEILRLFDRMLDIYTYVESNIQLRKLGNNFDGKLHFKAGCNISINKTIRNQEAIKYNVFLRHKQIQKMIWELLVKEYGYDNVGTEIETGYGTLIDIAIKLKQNDYIYYEIKTSSTIKACIREALPQLLEYSYWNNSQKASKLIIISENKITIEAKEYLKFLRENFKIPIFYQQFLYDKNKLGILE